MYGIPSLGLGLGLMPSSACSPRAAFPVPKSRRATVVRLAGVSWVCALVSLFWWPELVPRVYSQKLSFFFNGFYGWNGSLFVSYSCYYFCKTELEKLLLLVSFGVVVVSWSRLS